MKNKFLSFWTFAMIAFVGVSVMTTSCKKDEPNPDPVPVVEDGIYIKGAGTAYTALEFVGKMDAGINEAVQVAKDGLYEMYLPVKAGTDGFNLVVVEGRVEKTFGPETSADVVIAGEDFQITATIKQGTAGEGKGNFTVAEDGMYHFVYDKTTGIYMIIPASKWELNGFGVMTMSAFSTSEMTWTVLNTNMVKGQKFKFRHAEGWKVIVDETEAGSVANIFNINTNFGGVISGNGTAGITLTLVPGGKDYEILADQTGKYDIELKWTKADGFTVTAIRKGDAVASYPEKLYMTGPAVGDWNWNAGVYIEMTTISNGKYEATATFTKDGTFRFFGQADWSPIGFNYPYFADGTVDANFVNAEDDDKNFKFVGTTGSYKISVDLGASTVTLAAAK